MSTTVHNDHNLMQFVVVIKYNALHCHNNQHLKTIIVKIMLYNFKHCARTGNLVFRQNSVY